MVDYKNVVDTDELIEFAIGNATVSERIGREATKKVVYEIFDNSLFSDLCGPILGLIYEEYDIVQNEDNCNEYDVTDASDCYNIILWTFMEANKVDSIWIKSDACDN